MNQLKGYRYCPLCAGKLKTAVENLRECSSCGYHFYINPKPCSAAIIENDKGEILLVRRKFEPHLGEWDLPGGFMTPFESVKRSIQREIQEELSVTISIGKFIGAYDDSYLYNNLTYPTISIVFSAHIRSGTISANDDISEYRFFPKEEVLKQTIAFKSMKEAIVDYLKIEAQNSKKITN